MTGPLRQFITLAVSLVAVGSALSAARPGGDRIVFARLGPVSTGLFLADGNGTNERALMPASSRDYNPSFSADGRWITFTSDRAGSADIYRIRPDGSGLERLTDSPAFDDQGALSPDGRTLAFVSTRDGGFPNVWLLDLDTRRTRNLTKSRKGNFRPSWSPDGRRISFSSARESPHQRMVFKGCCGWELMQFTAIYIVQVDGNGLRRLTPPGGSAGSPNWSPDGRRIVYHESSDGKASPQIVSIDVLSGVRENLTNGPGGKLSPQYLSDGAIGYVSSGRLARTSGTMEPEQAVVSNASWSPDATLVVYSKSLGQSGREPFPLVPGVGTVLDAELHLSSANPFSVHYSPDGRQAVFARNDRDYQSIEIVNADGSGTRQVFGSRDPGMPLGAMSWSPDGTRIAFTIGRLASRDPVTPAQIAVIGSDGSGFRMLTSGDNSSAFPSFSPDGKRIVYRVLGSEQGLRIVSLESGRTVSLTTHWDNFPAWSPRGDRIAFTGFRNGDFEIYTIRPDGSTLRQLTNDHGNNAHPVWSPDGNSILFTSSKTGWKDELTLTAQGAQTNGDLFVMNADGRHLRQLTDNQWEEAPTAWLRPVNEQ